MPRIICAIVENVFLVEATSSLVWSPGSKSAKSVFYFFSYLRARQECGDFENRYSLAVCDAVVTDIHIPRGKRRVLRIFFFAAARVSLEIDIDSFFLDRKKIRNRRESITHGIHLSKETGVSPVWLGKGRRRKEKRVRIVSLLTCQYHHIFLHSHRTTQRFYLFIKYVG